MPPQRRNIIFFFRLVLNSCREVYLSVQEQVVSFHHSSRSIRFPIGLARGVHYRKRAEEEEI
jgi:hypothetical protein